MTKTDLIEKLNKENYCTKKDAEALVNAVFDAIREALASGDKVTISKFGTFEVRERSAKECKNPRTASRYRLPLRRHRYLRQARI